MSILTQKKSGVYAIVNKVNGHRYIGSSVYIYNRWKTHRHNLNQGKHHSGHLQNAWNKYGANYFVFSVLEYCERSKLIEREQFYIDLLCPEYNITKRAVPSLGRKQSPETIAKRFFWQKGYKHSLETRAKIGNGNKGKIRTQEFRQRLSVSQKGRVSNRLGCKLSIETRKKISEAQKGKTISKESAAKVSRALKGRPKSKKHNKKVSDAIKLWWKKRKEQIL